MTDWTVSPNLALDQMVAERRARGEDIVHLGFGESRLALLPSLIEQLTAGAYRSRYGPIAGTAEVRQAVAGYFARRGLLTDPTQIVMAPGSKPLLMALQAAIPGDVIVPRPAWNTYVPQVEFAGKKAIRVPIPAEAGGIPDPAALRAVLKEARTRGHRPQVMILTLPDNPTGTVAPPVMVRQLCTIAEEEDLVIISDEIYRDVVHDPTTAVLSPAEIAPDRTVVVTGLSKNLALGGWRIGAVRLPEGQWGEQTRQRVTAYASEVWSALAGPMQEVATYVYGEPPDVQAYLVAAARLHGMVARAVHGIVIGHGAICRVPQAGFYLYPDYEPLRDSLARDGAVDSATLQHHILEDLGVAVLAGRSLGDDHEALRFRIATSMLYGDTEELRWESLHARDPLALPHVAGSLAVIEERLAKLGQ